MLPREISLEVPAMGPAITFHLKNVQLNPPPMQARIWQPPQIPGEPDIQLVDILPEEPLQASPYHAANHDDAGMISLPDYTADEGLAWTRDIRGVSGTGGNLQPSAWGNDPADNLPIRGISDSDPSSRWDDISGTGFGDIAAGVTAFDADHMGGDAPAWGADDPYAPTPSETVREFEPTPQPAFDTRPEWAQ